MNSVQEGDPVLTESEWLESLVAKADMSNVYTKDEVNQKFTDLAGSAPEAFDTLKEISDELTNSSTAVTAIINTLTHKVDSSVVYTKQEIDASIVAYAQPKGNYLTEHQDISNKADKSELPTKVSDLENDSKYLTAIDVSQFLTEHQPLDEYAKIEDINSSINDINSSIINSDASISEIKEQISAIDSSWDNYYTKEEVNTTIDDINTSINNMSTRVDNIDSSWNNYYTKEEINGTFDTINASINIVDSSIVRIDETIDNIQEAVDNADSSIEYIKGQLENIDASWASYLTVDSFNKFLEADADETINKFNEIVDFLAGIDTTDDTLYNTLQSINTSINDISSRLHDIDSSWNNYYTKDEIDDTIEVVNASIINTDSSIVTINEKLQNIDSSWDNYYDKETIDASIVEYAQPKGEYLTEHQDLSLLATKFEVSTGYYNKHEVE